MWTWDQVVQFVVQDYDNFYAHQWLLGFAAFFGVVTAIWRGTITLPGWVGAWIKKEQARPQLSSTWCQYISIALVAITSVITAASTGLPIKQAIAAAISTALMGLFGHDAIKVGVKAGLKATPPAAMFAIVLGCVLVPATSGCAWLQSACGSATPAIEAAQIYTADAESVIQGTRITVASIVGIPADKLAQINKYLDDAETIIGSMRATEAAAISACAQPNMAGLIASLVALWTELEPIVAPLLLTKQPLRTPQYVLTARVRTAHK